VARERKNIVFNKKEWGEKIHRARASCVGEVGAGKGANQRREQTGAEDPPNAPGDTGMKWP